VRIVVVLQSKSIVGTQPSRDANVNGVGISVQFDRKQRTVWNQRQTASTRQIAESVANPQKMQNVKSVTFRKTKENEMTNQ
jgi:hypothetical protein